MSCNETIEDINEVANEYFRNPTEDGKQKLCRMIYEDGSLKKILLKSFNSSKTKITKDDLNDVKHNVYIKLSTRVFEDGKYSPERGVFINYLRRSFFEDCKGEIEKIIKQNEDLLANTKYSAEGEEEDVLDDGKEIEQRELRLPKYQKPDDVVLMDETIGEILKTMNYFYKLTKSGQKNKGLVVIFLLQEILADSTDDKVSLLLQKYDFFKDNADFVNQIRCDRKLYSQSDFSKLTGMPEKTLSKMKNDLQNFIKANVDYD